MAETPSTTAAAEQPTPAQAEAEAAAGTVGVGAGAGGADVLAQMAEGNPNLFNNGAAKSGQ